MRIRASASSGPDDMYAGILTRMLTSGPDGVEAVEVVSASLRRSATPPLMLAVARTIGGLVELGALERTRPRSKSPRPHPGSPILPHDVLRIADKALFIDRMNAYMASSLPPSTEELEWADEEGVPDRKADQHPEPGLAVDSLRGHGLDDGCINALRKAGVRTLGQLSELDEPSLRQSFGLPKSQRILKALSTSRLQTTPKAPADAVGVRGGRPIDSIGLPEHMTWILQNAGIRTAEDASLREESSYRGLMGKSDIGKLKWALLSVGLSFPRPGHMSDVVTEEVTEVSLDLDPRGRIIPELLQPDPDPDPDPDPGAAGSGDESETPAGLRGSPAGRTVVAHEHSALDESQRRRVLELENALLKLLSGRWLKRSELFEAQSEYWQLTVLRRLTEVGYLKRVGVKNGTRYSASPGQLEKLFDDPVAMITLACPLFSEPEPNGTPESETEPGHALPESDSEPPGLNTDPNPTNVIAVIESHRDRIVQLDQENADLFAALRAMRAELDAVRARLEEVERRTK